MSARVSSPFGHVAPECARVRASLRLQNASLRVAVCDARASFTAPDRIGPTRCKQVNKVTSWSCGANVLQIASRNFLEMSNLVVSVDLIVCLSPAVIIHVWETYFA